MQETLVKNELKNEQVMVKNKIDSLKSHKRISIWTLVLSILVLIVTVGTLIFVWIVSAYEINGVDLNELYFKNKFSFTSDDINPYLNINSYMFTIVLLFSIFLLASSKKRIAKLNEVTLFYENKDDDEIKKNMNYNAVMNDKGNTILAIFLTFAHILSITVAAATGILILSQALTTITYVVTPYLFLLYTVPVAVVGTLVLSFMKNKSVLLLFFFDVLGIAYVYLFTQFIFVE